MSEIKLRAWIEADKTMHMVRLVDFAPDGMPISMRVADPLQCDDDGNVEWDFSEYRSGFILEQYTGLKDKTGREIYEGDIAKPWGHIAIMKYLPNHCRFMWTRMIDEYNEFVYDPEPKHEVIGNIHENPELLTNA